MKIRRIPTELYSPIAGGQPAPQRAEEPRADTAEVQRQAASSEAVKLASDFGAGTETPEARAARVADLRDKVERGEYKPDLKKVAEAVIKELFA